MARRNPKPPSAGNKPRGKPPVEKYPTPSIDVPVSTAGKSNVPDEVYERHLRIIQRDRDAMLETKEAYQEANSVYRTSMKAAKKDGVDIDAVALAMRLMERERGEVATEIRNTWRVLRLLGSPLGEQMNLFDAPPETAPDDPEAAGYHASENNEGASNNPHVAGTSEHAEWQEGWMRSQAMRARRMAPQGAGAATN